jgi:hypothetical protein
MNAKDKFAVLALLLGVALACNDDSAGPAASDITGTWQATQVEYVSVAQPTVSIDLIADEDYSATLVLASSGSYTFTLTPPGGQPTVDTGTWELDGEVLTVAPAGTQFTLQFDIALSGDTLRLSGADAEYDFDDDTIPEDAKLNLVVTR